MNKLMILLESRDVNMSLIGHASTADASTPAVFGPAEFLKVSR